MANLNLVMLMGNLGNDPELRFTPNGNPVCTFRIAINRTYTTEGEQRKETEWVPIVTWNKLAERCNQFLVKGRNVYVSGSLKTRSWQGDDGKKVSRTEVIAREVKFLDKAPAREQSGDDEAPNVSGPYEEEDLPW